MLPVSVLGVLATVLGGAFKGQYGNLAWLARQIMPDTSESQYLERWAGIWGVSRKLANAAQFQVIANGTNGADIPAGTLIGRSDAAQFATNADIGIANGSAALTVTALAAGSAGNTPAGSQLSFSSSVPNVQLTLTVGTQIVAGNDDETDPNLLSRLLFRIQNPPQGGCATDYVTWATNQPGVTRAWVYPRYLGLGTVGVAFVMDGRPNIFPLPADVAAVQAAIAALAPVTVATLALFSPVQQPINPVIHLHVADTPVIRAAVIAQLTDFVTQVAQPGAAIGQPQQGTIYLSQLEGAIGNSAGVVDYTLISPTQTQVMAPGVMAVLGQVIFQ
jgi:uncharacterized phage protein gp47/JayE